MNFTHRQFMLIAFHIATQVVYLLKWISCWITGIKCETWLLYTSWEEDDCMYIMIKITSLHIVLTVHGGW